MLFSINKHQDWTSAERFIYINIYEVQYYLKAGKVFNHTAHEAHLHPVFHAVKAACVSPPIEAAMGGSI